MTSIGAMSDSAAKAHFKRAAIEEAIDKFRPKSS